MVIADLVGKSLIETRSDSGNIYFITTDGVFIATPYGDCCASCYVNGVNGSEALQGATVLEIEDLELDRNENGPDEVVESWGYKFKTTRGYCTIDMRLEHNGYYGGELLISPIEGAVPSRASILGDFE